MTKSEIEAIRKRCSEVSAMLEGCEDALHEWGDGREKLAKRFVERMTLYRKVSCEMPKDWIRYACAQYVFGKLFCPQSRKVARFLKSDFGRSLPPAIPAQVRTLSRLPWFYGLFSVTEVAEGNLMRIKEWILGKEFLLESDGTMTAHARGMNLFMTLLFDNGCCLQSYGLLHYYRGYSPVDFAYLAGVLKERPQDVKDIGAVIEQHPVEFMLMDRFAEIPPTRGPDGETHLLASSIPARTFHIHDPEGAFARDESGGVVRYSLKAGKKPCGSWLYHDAGNAELWALSIGPDRYDVVRAAAGAVPMPPRPQWQATMSGVVYANVLLDKQFPGIWYDTLFTRERPSSPEQERALASLNAFLRDYTEMCFGVLIKHGLVETNEKVVLRKGLPDSVSCRIRRTAFFDEWIGTGTIRV